jgi:hypothetical protein
MLFIFYQESQISLDLHCSVLIMIMKHESSQKQGILINLGYQVRFYKQLRQINMQI